MADGDERSRARVASESAADRDDESGGAADGVITEVITEVVTEVAPDADTPIGESVESPVTAVETVPAVDPLVGAVPGGFPVTAVEPNPEPSPEPDPTALAEQRRALIDLVIYAYDRTTSTGIRARLAAGLRGVGVAEVVPDGEQFDAAHHEAGGVEPTDVEALQGRIAETERAGFVDGARIVREPIVVVYRPR